MLTILTELLRVDRTHRPSHCLLQQPEMHLHLSAQASLDSLFCQTTRPAQQLRVATHSYYLLDRIRLDIRDQKPDDIPFSTSKRAIGKPAFAPFVWTRTATSRMHPGSTINFS